MSVEVTPGAASAPGEAGEGADVARFKAAMSRFATGVAIVSACDAGEPVGFTCQSLVSLSLDPPLLALAPAKCSTSWPRIARAGTFCANILSQEQLTLCKRFAKSGGDKFSGTQWRPGRLGAPVLSGSLAAIECRVEIVHDAGDHEIVVGRVANVQLGDGEPLIFYRSSFTHLLRC